MYTKLAGASTSVTSNGTRFTSRLQLANASPFHRKNWTVSTSFLFPRPITTRLSPSFSLFIPRYFPSPNRSPSRCAFHALLQKACRFQISVSRPIPHFPLRQNRPWPPLLPSASLLHHHLLPYPLFQSVSIFTMERSRTISSLSSTYAQREQLPLCINYPLDWPQAPNGRSYDGAA